MIKKKILITGKGSYIGTNLIEWLKQWPDQYEIDEISVRGDGWKTKSFSEYDSVLHVAGIAHVSTDPKMEERYYEINRDLTLEVAKKAKVDGVKQFIFMSSIIVYGSEKTVIDRNTIPLPENFYGNSKLQAENGLKKIKNENFKIAIIRPPMIYGKNSKGNYPKLVKLVRILPVFPNIENKRSMLFIENLNEFLRLVIDNDEDGLFFPQNREYVSTKELVKLINKVYKRNILFTNKFNWPITILKSKINPLDKLFGSLIYQKEMSIYKENYQMIDLKDSIMKTELEDIKVEKDINLS